MKGTKYLSELVDFEKLYVNVINIINAPTGSGKTYFALHTIPEHCRDAVHQSLFLIDTINGKDQILRNYNARRVSKKWIEDIKEGGLWFAQDKQIVIMTYALLGCILETEPDFCNKFYYIVCDELHKLIDFQHYSKQPNSHSIAKHGLERAVANNKTIVIALSATPKKIYNGFNVECKHLPIDKEELRSYETKNIIKYSSLKNLIMELDPNKRGLCYTSRINKMKEIYREAAAAGLKPIAIWSINNTDHVMDEEQLRVRSVILEEYRIPSEYNLLIINSSSETSIKIKSRVDYVIVNHSDKDIQTQVRGRVDNDLQTLYLPTDDAESVIIPEEYLDKELYSEEKKKLCKVLDIKGTNGRQLQWTSIKAMLQENNSNYTIVEKRRNNRRYAIISRKQ